MNLELNSTESEVRTEIPAVSWEEFISKIKEYLANQGEDVELCMGFYEDFLHDTWEECFVLKPNPKYISLDEPALNNICLPILMGI